MAVALVVSGLATAVVPWTSDILVLAASLSAQGIAMGSLDVTGNT